MLQGEYEQISPLRSYEYIMIIMNKIIKIWYLFKNLYLFFIWALNNEKFWVGEQNYMYTWPEI